jgi:cytochrome c oxidase assembly protein subunit 20
LSIGPFAIDWVVYFSGIIKADDFFRIAPIPRAANWAVGTFVFASFANYEFCLYRRRLERAHMKRAVEIIDRKKLEKKEKEAEAQRKREERRRVKEEQDKAEEEKRKRGSGWGWKFW